ncbi:nucleoside deaminase [Micromonospora sp. CA-259024]|uniref:nucleoside deaminase n=1 Tax=Micromonospora sp. CA-259024 TaxID=3239965 RepID=UPI003D8AAA24
MVGEGTSSLVELRDPTAHAEVMALRDAGSKPGRHLLEDGAMYASSEPCPMCLMACYWARIPYLIFGASSHDVATYGFEDLQLYREAAQPAEHRPGPLRHNLAPGGPVETTTDPPPLWWADGIGQADPSHLRLRRS